MLSTLDNAIDFVLEVVHFYFFIPYLLYEKYGNAERQKVLMAIPECHSSLINTASLWRDMKIPVKCLS